MNSHEIQIKALDPTVLQSIVDEIYHYVTAFVVLFMEDGKPVGRLHGSGTFVHVGDKYGVLTAYHVAHSKPFKESEKIGLVVMKENHHCSIPREYVTVIDVGIPRSQQDGPDLSVVLLGGSPLSSAQTHKSFWSLEMHRDAVLQESYPSDLGVYCLFGCPFELSGDENTAPGFTSTKRVFGLGGFSCVDRTWETNGFDYMDYVVSYDAESDSPKSFEGVSGAGLWHVLLKRAENGSITYERPMLNGVAYFQSPIENNLRSIYCHGRKSIYESAMLAMKHAPTE